MVWTSRYSLVARLLSASYRRIPDPELRLSAPCSVFVFSKGVLASIRGVGCIYIYIYIFRLFSFDPTFRFLDVFVDIFRSWCDLHLQYDYPGWAIRMGSIPIDTVTDVRLIFLKSELSHLSNEVPLLDQGSRNSPLPVRFPQPVTACCCSSFVCPFYLLAPAQYNNSCF